MGPLNGGGRLFVNAGVPVVSLGPEVINTRGRLACANPLCVRWSRCDRHVRLVPPQAVMPLPPDRVVDVA
jgi:hypothetical protein